jgi:hypothetical protein
MSCQQNVSRRRIPDPAVSAPIRVPRAPAVPPPGPAPARRFPRSRGRGALPTPARTRTARRTVPAATSPPQESQPNTSRIPAPPIRGAVIHNHDRNPRAGLSGRKTGPAPKQSGRHQTTPGICNTPETHLTLKCSPTGALDLMLARWVGFQWLMGVLTRPLGGISARRRTARRVHQAGLPAGEHPRAGQEIAGRCRALTYDPEISDPRRGSRTSSIISVTSFFVGS